MTASIKTLLFDFRLTTEDDVTDLIIKTLESEAFSTSDKFTKLTAVQVGQKSPEIRTSIFETETSDALVVIRMYDKSGTKDGLAHVTLAVELKA